MNKQDIIDEISEILTEHLEHHINKLRFIRELAKTADPSKIYTIINEPENGIFAGLSEILYDVTLGYDNFQNFINNLSNEIQEADHGEEGQ